MNKSGTTNAPRPHPPPCQISPSDSEDVCKTEEKQLLHYEGTRMVDLLEAFIPVDTMQINHHINESWANKHNFDSYEEWVLHEVNEQRIGIEAVQKLVVLLYKRRVVICHVHS